MRKSRQTVTFKQIERMFSSEKKAEKWLVESIYGSREEMHCPRCGSVRISDVKHPTMPYRCKDCRKHFSIRTKTVMECSNLPLTDWAKMIYIMTTELRGRAAMKTHNDLGVDYNTAWFMNHRLRKAYENLVEGLGRLSGTVEADETAIGGSALVMNKKQHKAFKERGGGQGFKGKEVIGAVLERETGKIIPKVLEGRKKEDLEGLVRDNVEEGSRVLTDEASGYKNLKKDYQHETVNHGTGKYVDGDVHNNTIESHWNTIKRGIKGHFYKISPKHTERYAFEFADRHNDCPQDTLEMMRRLARGMAGVRLTWKDLTAENGKSNFARPESGTVRERKMLIKKEKKRRAQLWKAWKNGYITPETDADLAALVAEKKAAGKWEDRIPY